MFKNNLKLVLRKLKKEKLYAFVNVFSLTVGLTAFLIIALYVRDEMSFDEGVTKNELTYRVVSSHTDWGVRGIIPSNYIEIINESTPQIVDHSRLAPNFRKNLLTVDDKSIYVNQTIRVDRNFFEFFDFKLIDANPETVFQHSQSVVITPELAKKLFGEENPIGKEVSFNKKETLVVSALVEPARKNSTIQFELLRYDKDYFRDAFNESGGVNVTTYVALAKNASVLEVTERVNAAKSIPVYQMFLEDETYSLLQFEDQRLNAPYQSDVFGTNSMSYVLLFMTIGLVVLLLAVINYINLVTAQAVRRTKEVGLRKVIGATKRQLVIYQFIESITVTMLSVILSFALAERLLPVINELLSKELRLDYLSFDFLVWVVIMGGLIGLMSGAYPAYNITRFGPLALIQKMGGTGGKGGMRRALVLFQFVTSGVLLVVLVIISQQMSFLKNKDLGFKSDFLVSVPLYRDSVQLFQTVKNEINEIAGLESVSLSGFQPGRMSQTSMSDNPDRKAENRLSSRVGIAFADQDFLKTTELKLVWKTPSFEMSNFNERQVIINETLAKKFNWTEEPMGARLFGYRDKEGLEVVAIVEDFHLQSLKEEISPYTIQYLDDWGTRNLLLRINGSNREEVLAQVGISYEKIFNRPFEYSYVNDVVKGLYQKEEGQFKLFQVFAILAISISLLGLVGLTIFTVEQRRKEVSIRKVLGASVSRLILLLNKEYSTLVVIAFVIASPIAYYAIEGWLDQFKYRITVSPLLFTGAFLSFLLLSWLVTLFQSLKVSAENPADVLRDD